MASPSEYKGERNTNIEGNNIEKSQSENGYRKYKIKKALAGFFAKQILSFILNNTVSIAVINKSFLIST